MKQHLEPKDCQSNANALVEGVIQLHHMPKILRLTVLHIVVDQVNNKEATQERKVYYGELKETASVCG